MRKVALSFPASEQLLELVTLDVYAGRRSLAQARVLNAAFDEMIRGLSNAVLGPSDFGRATKYFFGLLKDRFRRIIHYRLAFGVLTVTLRFDDAANQCTIESVELV